MADTNTDALSLLLMEIDSHENTWGDELNNNFTKIDEAIAGQVAHATTGGTVTLTEADVRAAFHRVTGVLASNSVIEVPAAANKIYDWRNETTGNFTVTVKVNGQTGVVLPRNDTLRLRCNGTDVINTGFGQGGASGVSYWVGTLGFAGDAYSAAALPQVPTTLVDGLTLEGLINDANTTTTPTLNYGAGGAKTIVMRDGAALAIGEMQASQMGRWKYRVASDKWHWMNPPEARTRGPATFTKPVSKTTTVLTDAATIAWDLSTGANFEVTITSNRALGAFTGGTVGQEGFLTIKQDGTGGWSLNLGDAVYDFLGPAIENIARGANDETIYAYKVISAGSMILRRLGATSIGGSGRDLLEVKAANNSATIDFVLTKWLALYDRFEVDFDNLVPATDGAGFLMRTSTNGGSSYDSGASDYAYIYDRLANTVVDGQVSAGDTKIELAPANVNIGLSNVSTEPSVGMASIHTPGSATKCMVRWGIAVNPANPGFVLARYQGNGVRNTAADVDAIRFLMSSGNISTGSFRLYGIRG